MSDITQSRHHQEVERGRQAGGQQVQQTRRVDTEITERNVPMPKSGPVTDTTLELEAKLAQVQRDFDEFNRKLAEDEKLAESKESQLEYFRRESQRLASEITSQQAKGKKSEEKQILKLEKAEAAAMGIATQLSEQQAHERELTQAKIDRIGVTEAEARQLASELLQKNSENRQFAENRVQDLFEAECQAREKVRELEEMQKKMQKEIDIRQTETITTEQTARKQLDQLTKEQAVEKGHGADIAISLQKVQSELEVANELAQTSSKARVELEQRLSVLQQKEADARNRVQELIPVQERDQRLVLESTQDLANRQGELDAVNQQMKQDLEQKRTIDISTRELVQNEAESLKRANTLLARLGRERALAEAKVRELKEQEEEARATLEQLTSTSQLKATSEPAVVDVYQHTRYETTEPGISVEPAKEEEQSMMGKIGSGIKNLF